VKYAFASAIGRVATQDSVRFVDWKELLRDVASELKLDIDRESDLIALAQYDVNERKGRGATVRWSERTKRSRSHSYHSTQRRCLVRLSPRVETRWGSAPTTKGPVLTDRRLAGTSVPTLVR
jgi:hypothetical protein